MSFLASPLSGRDAFCSNHKPTGKERICQVFCAGPAPCLGGLLRQLVPQDGLLGGQLLVVSNFTLGTDCKRGRRPSFDMAAPPELAKALYERLVERARAQDIHVETGEFGEHMHVLVDNDGPVNIIIDTEKIGK